jgi:Domain of unknown function (DUF4395)
LGVERLFNFPNPVNEVAARVVAGGVVLMALAYLATHSPFVLAVLAYGFVARVLTGPTLSPLGRLATQVVAPAIGRERFVPGPPKRFAQGIGATLTVSAVIAHAAGAGDVALWLVAAVAAAATLESVFAVCLGCNAFALLMRLGVVPDDVCAECADIHLRQPA